MFSKFELIIGGLCTVAMACALFLIQERAHFLALENNTQTAQAPEPGIIIVNPELGQSTTSARVEAFQEAINQEGKFSRMVIDDIKVGTGDEVQSGNTVLVHYVGTLHEGMEFDNSRKRGQPLDFTVGAGQVIKGWDEGLVGMKVGGERILVIPPEKAYGDRGIGPIPGGATLVFKIELLEIK